MPLLLYFLFAAVAVSAIGKKSGRRKKSNDGRDEQSGKAMPLDDFPAPYRYRDVLAVARELVPSNMTVGAGGALDVPLFHEQDQLWLSLDQNIKAIDQLAVKPWLKAVNLFYHVIWPFFAAGLGGRNMTKGKLTPFYAALLKKFDACALYSVLWLIGPTTAVVPRSATVLAVATGTAAAALHPNTPVGRYSTSAESFKRPTVREQSSALLDLHLYLGTYGRALLPSLGSWYDDLRAVSQGRIIYKFSQAESLPSATVADENRLLVEEIAQLMTEVARGVMLQGEGDVLTKQKADSYLPDDVAKVLMTVFQIAMSAVGAGIAAEAGTIAKELGKQFGGQIGEVMAFVSSALSTGNAVVKTIVDKTAAAVLQAAVAGAAMQVVSDAGLHELASTFAKKEPAVVAQQTVADAGVAAFVDSLKKD